MTIEDMIADIRQQALAQTDLLTEIRDRLPKEEPAWVRDGIIPTLQRMSDEKADLIDDDTEARYEREDAEARQDDSDTVTLRRDDAEALLRFWEIAGGNGVVRDIPRRTRAALGWGDSDDA